jgi:uncharacterized protein YidB (DUF937 family)
VKGCRYTIAVPYLDNTGTPTDPTTPDTERSIDGAAFADTTEEVTTITGANGMGYITLTGDEMNGSLIAVAFKVTSGPKPTLASLYPRVLPVLYSGTATAGAASTITLSATAPPPVDEMILGCIIRTTGGTGGGGGSGFLGNQARVITDYVASTRVVTVSPAWETTPASGTTYEILITEVSFISFADVRAIEGAALATHTAGHNPADVRTWIGATPNALISGKVDANAQVVGDKTGYALANPAGVQKNVALNNFTFAMYDATDHFTLKTGLTITATRSIDGAAYAACANAASEIGTTGTYKINLATTDLNGDVIALRFTATGAEDTLFTIITEP